MPKFPIGFWNYVSAKTQGPEAVKDWVDCGMTVAMGPVYDPTDETVREHMHGVMQECASHGTHAVGWDGVEHEEAFRARHAEFSELMKWFKPAHLYRVELQA